MRIIDKNTDFYDYLQNVYPDSSTTFDRTDSFVVTKSIMCENLYSYRWERTKNKHRFVLLQVCNTFWLFLLEITAFDEYERASNYKIELLKTWKNYNKPRRLISLDVISFVWNVNQLISVYRGEWKLNKESIYKRLPALIQAIDTNNIEVRNSINHYSYFKGDYKTRVEKHIPLLIACGIGNCIEPLDIYLSFEEYFSLEKQSHERTSSIGLTDKEKIENHGFDTKVSFRGNN